jgi:hypothetical protein
MSDISVIVVIIVLAVVLIVTFTSIGRKRLVALGLALTSLAGGFYTLSILAFKAAEFSRVDLRLYGEDPYALALRAAIALSLSVVTSAITLSVLLRSN